MGYSSSIPCRSLSGSVYPRNHLQGLRHEGSPMDARPAADSTAIVDLLEQRVGHRFNDAALAIQAVTHSSAKDARLPSNERMEFFGDAIVGLVVSEFLF